MKNPRRITLHPNGASMRRKNARCTFVVDNDEKSVLLEFIILDLENADSPACRHFSFRNKIRGTKIKITRAGMEQMCIAWHLFREKEMADQVAQYEKETKP